jgi:hypothetical protein
MHGTAETTLWCGGSWVCFLSVLGIYGWRGRNEIYFYLSSLLTIESSALAVCGQCAKFCQPNKVACCLDLYCGTWCVASSAVSVSVI